MGHPADDVVVTAVFSAFLDNVTTVLLTVPVTLLITDELKVKPYPYLFAQIFSSNIGGTATLIGDPPNIMIGSATGLTFNDFGLALTPVILVVMVATMIPFYLIWGRQLTATDENRRQVMGFHERETITDPRLLKQSLDGHRAGDHRLHAAAADPYRASDHRRVRRRGAAAARQFRQAGEGAVEERPRRALRSRMDHADVLPRAFRLVHGIDKAGLIDIMAQNARATGGDFATTAVAILWASAVLSAFIDNIPFVATMIPLIKAMAPAFGGENALLPLWWALSLGACLGGNGTLIGASANLVVAGLAERAGTTFRFVEFMKVAFPLMLLSIVICHAYLVMRYLNHSKEECHGTLHRTHRDRRLPPVGLARRSAGNPRGSIVVAQEIFGVNSHIRASATGLQPTDTSRSRLRYSTATSRRRIGYTPSGHREGTRVEGARGARPGVAGHCGRARRAAATGRSP